MEIQLLPPEDQAKIDFNIGRDIGYNPYQIYSSDWQKYRELFLHLQEKFDTKRKKAV